MSSFPEKSLWLTDKESCVLSLCKFHNNTSKRGKSWLMRLDRLQILLCFLCGVQKTYSSDLSPAIKLRDLRPLKIEQSSLSLPLRRVKYSPILVAGCSLKNKSFLDGSQDVLFYLPQTQKLWEKNWKNWPFFTINWRCLKSDMIHFLLRIFCWRIIFSLLNQQVLQI